MAAHRRLLPMMTVSSTRYLSKANWSWLSTPSFLRADHRSLLRLQLAGQQLHESGFAGAVRPGQAVALPRRKGRGYLVEQNFGAVAHGHVTD